MVFWRARRAVKFTLSRAALSLSRLYAANSGALLIHKYYVTAAVKYARVGEHESPPGFSYLF